MATIQGKLLDEGGWARNVQTLGINPGTVAASLLSGLPPGHYLVPAGTYTIDGSVEVTAGVTLEFARGAVFQTTPGATLVLNELPHAGQYKIFDHSNGGELMLSADARTGEVWVDWWGWDRAERWDGALLRAMHAVGSADRVGGGGVIRFGRGIYKFGVSGTFSRFSYLGIKRGFLFRGEGPQSTLLMMECGGTEKWFYDSVNMHGRWTFQDLGFSSDDAGKGRGFRHQSTGSGEEKEFRYYNCHFGTPAHQAFFPHLVFDPRGLNIGFWYAGTTNADLNKWFGCRFGGFRGGLLHFDNNQSVSHAMLGCDAELTGTFATTHGHAGGDMKVFGGTMVMHRPADGDTTEYYVVDHKGSEELWPGNSTFVFNGVRFEFHDYASMVIKRQDEEDAEGVSNTVFRDCDMFVAGSTRVGVDIVQNAMVAFERTNIPSSLFTYVVRSTASITPEVGTGGIILFNTCHVPVNLAELATLAAVPEDPDPADAVSTAGRVIAEGCYHHLRLPDPVQRRAIDFDKGWQNMARLDRAVMRKLVAIKARAEAWPRPGGVTEYALLLPPGAVVCGIRVFKPAMPAATGTYQLRVGSGNPAQVYASSTSAGGMASDEHRIMKSDLSIEMGTTESGRTLRLWMTGTSTTEQANTGYALVEYI